MQQKNSERQTKDLEWQINFLFKQNKNKGKERNTGVIFLKENKEKFARQEKEKNKEREKGKRKQIKEDTK